eukprot:SAG11_NODE_24_length_24699_cov_10.132195_19_plen_47_part_00
MGDGLAELAEDRDAVDDEGLRVRDGESPEGSHRAVQHLRAVYHSAY